MFGRVLGQLVVLWKKTGEIVEKVVKKWWKCIYCGVGLGCEV